jgi:branched-subunit amino acid aminotransferase/4-amino-4-deoxychorismate lyase
VDSARAAVETAQRNFAKNAERLGKAATAAEFVVGDAFEFLEAARASGQRWSAWEPTSTRRSVAWRRSKALAASQETVA